MTGSQQSVASAALAVAFAAKARTLDPMDVGRLQVQAEQLLDHKHPLFFAVSEFATQFELHRHDATGWPDLGHRLLHAIDVAITPPPPDHARRDIHG